MSAHLLRSLCVPTVLAFLVVLGVAGCDDSAKIKQLQETVANQDAKIAALEAQVKELEQKQAAEVQHTQPDKDDEYVIAIGGAAIQALLAGETTALRGHLSTKLDKAIDALAVVDFFGHKNDAVADWVAKWNPNKEYRSYKVDKVVFSPDKSEAVLTGTLTGRDVTPKGSFSITLVKEKDKYLIDACSAKP